MSIDLLSESLLMSPNQDLLSDFEDSLRWNSIWDALRSVSLDPKILLDTFCIMSKDCSAIADGFSQGTSSVVSDGFFLQRIPGWSIRDLLYYSHSGNIL